MYVAADTIDYLTAQFVFQTSEWDGLEVWSHWEKGGVVYDIRLEDGRITKGMHLNLSAGAWKVYLHGNRYADGVVVERITTGAAVLEVQPTGAMDGEPFPEIPASVTEQILARLKNIEQSGGGTGSGGVQVDETLTKAGYAADAAAVGDALKTKLGADELDGAVNTALSRAKESGKFDGAQGQPGIPPHIGENGNWWIGDIDTGIPAQGEPGVPGASQTISVSERNPMYGGGVNITVTNPDGTFSTAIVRDGADGEPGVPGEAPHIGENGNWYIGDTDTGVRAQGEQGIPGEPYTLTEEDKDTIVAAVLAALPIWEGGAY